MRDDNRTDLPHDQVAQDNDGQVQNEGQRVEVPSIGIDERATGMSPPMGVENDVTDAEANASESYRQNVPTEDFADEETAAEVAPVTRPFSPDFGKDKKDVNNEAEVENSEQIHNIETMEEQEAGGTGLGWTALVLSIVSLFLMPILLASIGVITGFFAYRNGARTLGMWSIAIGLFSIVLGLFFTPFVR
jgi:hypothetical protein